MNTILFRSAILVVLSLYIMIIVSHGLIGWWGFYTIPEIEERLDFLADEPNYSDFTFMCMFVTVFAFPIAAYLIAFKFVAWMFWSTTKPRAWNWFEEKEYLKGLLKGLLKKYGKKRGSAKPKRRAKRSA